MIINRISVILLIVSILYSFNVFANGEVLNQAYIHDDLITRESKKHNIDSALIYSIIKVESNFNDKAVSIAGAKGLMQLMPKTAKRFGVIDSFDPEQNIRAGIEYISFLIDRYLDIKYAIAAYNSGEHSVDKYNGIPPYPETQNYVKKVTREYKKLTGLTLPEPVMFFVRK